MGFFDLGELHCVQLAFLAYLHLLACFMYSSGKGNFARNLFLGSNLLSFGGKNCKTVYIII